MGVAPVQSGLRRKKGPNDDELNDEEGTTLASTLHGTNDDASDDTGASVSRLLTAQSNTCNRSTRFAAAPCETAHGAT